MFEEILDVYFYDEWFFRSNLLDLSFERVLRSDLKRWNVRIHAVFSLLFVGILFNKRIERKFVPQRERRKKLQITMIYFNNKIPKFPFREVKRCKMHREIGETNFFFFFFSF